jgi:RluA family pseudouridine synthase
MKTIAFTVMASEAGQTLQDVLAGRLGLSRNRAKALLDARAVLVNRRPVWMARHAVNRGDVVEAAAGGASAAAGEREVPVLVEERDYLVANKPAGLAANGPDSAESALQTSRSDPSIRAVHRLDVDTSGCLLLARGDAAFEAAVARFRERAVEKIYRAIVVGRVREREREIAYPLEGRTAVTRIRVLAAAREATCLDVTIETGRTHQIRRHLSMIGHPVLGDRQYTARRVLSDREIAVPRQMLHAWSLAFPGPGNGRPIRAEAPLPGDFRVCLSRFHLRGA